MSNMILSCTSISKFNGKILYKTIIATYHTAAYLLDGVIRYMVINVPKSQYSTNIDYKDYGFQL